jgi:NAD(P)-dependent dehydrogenase (short-subunit alcohol dehydrogenase family)
MSILDKFRLDGQTAVVTGGNRGIGREIADGLADVGANVVVANRDEETGREAAEELAEEHGVETLWVNTDVSEEESVKGMVNETLDEFDDIDVLVNNAGVVSNYELQEMPLEEWQRIFDINVTGLFLCTKYVGEVMINGDGGNVVNMSSISAILANHPQPQPHYNASKGAVDGFTKQLASDWWKYGIRVNNISPGYILTDMIAQVRENDPELADQWVDQMVMDEFADPEVIAPLAIYLASEASEYMTGESVVIDGGLTIR